MDLFSVPDFTAPACAKPEHLELVDEAYRRPGGPAGVRMRRTLCTGCPALSQCLSEAMERGEWGIWAGTSPRARTIAGGAKPKTRTKAAA